MINKKPLQIAHAFLCISGICGAVMYAGEGKKQQNTKQTQFTIPNNKFNSFAHKIQRTEERDEDTYKELQKEFNTLFGIGTTALLPQGMEKNKRCVDEVKLLLDDFKADVRAEAISKDIEEWQTKVALGKKEATKLLASIAALRNGGNTEPVLSEQGAALLDKALGKPTREEAVEVPKITPSKTTETRVTPSVESVIERNRKEREAQDELEELPIPPEPSILERSKEAERAILEEPPIPETEDQGQRVTLEQLLTMPAKGVRALPSQELQSREYALLDDTTIILKEHAATPAQQKAVANAALQAELIMAELPAAQREPVAETMQRMTAAIAADGARAVAEPLAELVQASMGYTTALVPVTKGANAGQSLKVAFADLPESMFALFNGTILQDAKVTDTVAQGFNLFIRTCGKNNDLITPTVTSVLLLGAETEDSDALKATRDALQGQFLTYLTAFDALRDGMARALYDKNNTNALVPKLVGYNNTIWGLKQLWTGTSPEALVPGMINAYILFGSVGRTLLATLERFVMHNGGNIDSAFMKQWAAGKLRIPRAGSEANKQEFILHRYDYAKAFEEDLAKLKEAIENGIDSLATEPVKNEYRAKIDRIERSWQRDGKAAEKQAVAEKTFMPQKRKPKPFVPAQEPPKIIGQTAKTSKSPLLSAVREKRQTKEPVVSQPAELKSTPTPQQPAPESGAFVKAVSEEPPQEAPQTALPVMDPPEFRKLVQTIRDLKQDDITKDQILRFQKELSSFSTVITDGIDNKDYKTAQLRLLDLQTFLKNKERGAMDIQELRQYANAIGEDTKDEAIVSDASEMLLWSKALQRVKALPDDTPGKREALEEFKKQLHAYTGMVVTMLTQTKQYHSFIQGTVLDKSALEGVELIEAMSKTVNKLDGIQKIAEVSIKQEIDKAVRSICTIYDSLVYVLYTPTLFKPLIEKGKIKGEITYGALIERVLVLTKPLVRALDMLKELMTEGNKNKLDSGSFDIAAFDTALQTEDGVYKYAVPVGTPVAIDEGAEIPTLHALDSMHKKEYIPLLNEWLARVSERANIAAIKSEYAAATVDTLSDEKLKTLARNLEELRGAIPTLFEMDEDLQKLYETVIKKSGNAELYTVLNTLHKQIVAAQELYNKPEKTVTLIRFNEAMEKIKTLGDRSIFQGEIEKVSELFVDYLYSIAAYNVATIKDFPAQGFKGDKVLRERITTAIISGEFTKMLTQLDGLGWFKEIEQTDDPCNKLYTAIMQGYGYILATFDALTAKLHDGVEQQGTWANFLWGADEATHYASAQHIINDLLVPTANARSYYYTTLIAPYFETTRLIQNYRSGRLNLVTDLSLTDITNADGNYRYARTMTMTNKLFSTLGKKEKPIIERPSTGMHMRNPGSGAITNGGDAQYRAIIKAWESLINIVLETAFKENKQKVLEQKLKLILKTPLGRPRVTLVGGVFELPEKEPEYQNSFVTLHTSEKGGLAVYDYLNELRDATIEGGGVKEEKTLVVHAFLDNFFITLYDRVGDPDLPILLKEFADKGMLTDALRNHVSSICAIGFTLLDSLIKWGYVTVTKGPKNQAMRSLVGTTLGRYQPYIDSIVKSLMAFMPYAVETDVQAYGAEGFNIGPYAPFNRVTQTKGKPLLGSPEALTNYLFALGTIDTTGTASPVKFEGTELFLNGYYTQATLTTSLENLRTIMNKLGGKPAPIKLLEIMKLLEPIHTTFDKAQLDELPSTDDMLNLTKRMEPRFKEVYTLLNASGDLLEELKDMSLIDGVLHEAAWSLIRPYIFFSEKVVPQAQKEAYKELVTSFNNTVGGHLVDQNLRSYIAAILADKPLQLPKGPKKPKKSAPKTPKIPEVKQPPKPVTVEKITLPKNQ